MGLAGVVTGFVYGFWEASRLDITRSKVALPRLPNEFDGLTIAVLSDIHHGPLTGRDFVKRIVDETNALQPDLIAMPGDFVCSMHTNEDYFAPCFAELNKLRAPLGVFCVPGNHDHWERIARYRQALQGSQIQDLTDRGIWIERGGAKLRLAGVDDLWCGSPDLKQALGDCTNDDACILLCHNPDYVESLIDPRVALVLSGHLHGGQILLPFMRPRVPSNYGSKYLKGLIQGPATQVYVSRGLGTVGVPFRFRAVPEIALLTLTT